MPTSYFLLIVVEIGCLKSSQHHYIVIVTSNLRNWYSLVIGYVHKSCLFVIPLISMIRVTTKLLNSHPIHNKASRKQIWQNPYYITRAACTAMVLTLYRHFKRGIKSRFYSALNLPLPLQWKYSGGDLIAFACYCIIIGKSAVTSVQRTNSKKNNHYSLYRWQWFTECSQCFFDNSDFEINSVISFSHFLPPFLHYSLLFST